MWAPEQALQRVLVRGPERAPKTWMERGLQLQCSVPVMSRVLQAVPTLLPVPVLAPAQALDLMRALEPVQVPKTLMGTVAVEAAGSADAGGAVARAAESGKASLFGAQRLDFQPRAEL